MKNVPLVLLDNNRILGTYENRATKAARTEAIAYAMSLVNVARRLVPGDNYPHISTFAELSSEYHKRGQRLSGPGSRFNTADTETHRRAVPVAADYLNQVQKILICEMLCLTGKDRGQISGYQVYFCTPNPDESTGFTWESLAEKETWFPVQEPAAKPQGKILNPFTTGEGKR